MWSSAGVAVVALAAQLGVAQALGVIRWDASYPSDDDSGWLGLLGWLAFICAASVLAGAAMGRRAVIRPGRAEGVMARLTAALFAVIGACAAMTLIWLPARDATPPVAAYPDLEVLLHSGAGIIAGLVLALLALFVSPIAGNLRAVVAWVWLAGIGSAAAGLSSGEAFTSPRLGIVDAPSTPTGWWSGPESFIAVAGLLGLGVAVIARWGGAQRWAVAISGFAGPALVATSYLVAGSTADLLRAQPLRSVLIAVVAGLGASILVAVPPTRRGAAGARPQPTLGTPNTQTASGYPHSPIHTVPDSVYQEPPTLVLTDLAHRR